MKSLLNTAWKINETPTLTPFLFHINWRYNKAENPYPNLYSAFRCDMYYSYGLSLFNTASGNSGYIYYTYNGTKYYWGNQSNRTMVIIGGDDVENPDLIAWLQANAVQLDFVRRAMYDSIYMTAYAIRGKSGGSEPLVWDEAYGFMDAVNAIDLGTDTSTGTAAVDDIVEGVIAFSKGNTLVGTMASAEGVSF